MASTSSRLPQDVHIPPSPTGKKEKHRKENKRSRWEKKGGKGKEKAENNEWDLIGNEPSWDWQNLTDQESSDFPPLFTADGSYFFTLAGSSIKICSVATGQLVSTLTASETLTCAIINPHNLFQLITGSTSGKILLWDYMDAVLLQSFDLGQPIHQLCGHQMLKDQVFVAVSRPGKGKKKDDAAAVLRISLKQSETTTSSPANPSEMLVVGKTRRPTGLSISANGAWLVATAGHKVYVAVVSALRNGFVKYVSPERLTCLTFHPHDDYFATGDAKGVVRLWYCLNEDISSQIKAFGVEKRSQSAALHWHAHAVTSLRFSSSGALLLSGGEEAVLVAWQLQTGRKDFVPRLGAAIKSISRSKNATDEEYLIGLSDATWVFINANTLRIARSFTQIKLTQTLSYYSSSYEVPLAYHSPTSTLVLPSSHPSSLQIYSPASNKLVSELEVSPSNRVSRRDERPLQPSKVERAVISESGEWLATVDTRHDAEMTGAEVYLKLWRWDLLGSFWILNTRIDRPHGRHSPLCCSFSSSDNGRPLQLVTAGGDGSVRLWRMKTGTSKGDLSEVSWVSRAKFGHKLQIPSSVSWCKDSSIVAVTFKAEVLLLSSTTFTTVGSLSFPECPAPVAAQFFGHRHLVLHDLLSITVCDLITSSVIWHRKLSRPIDRVAPHSNGASMAVFHQSSSETYTPVSIFHISSNEPHLVRSIPFGLRSLVAISQSSDLQPSFSFVAVTQTWNVALLGDRVSSPKEPGSTANIIHHATSQPVRTLFQDIFGKSAFVELSETSSRSKVAAPDFQSASLLPQRFSHHLDAPSYLIPSLEYLFEPLVRTKDKQEGNTDGLETHLRIDETEEKDVDMFAQDDTQVQGSSMRKAVDEKEFSELLELFKMQSIKGTQGRKLLANGAPQPKAGIQGKPNGTKVSSHKRPQERMTSPPSVRASSPESVIVNGKKRKKTSS